MLVLQETQAAIVPDCGVLDLAVEIIPRDFDIRYTFCNHIGSCSEIEQVGIPHAEQTMQKYNS